MEKKEEITLIDAFKDFKEEKNIDRPVMMGVLKDVFLTQIAKTYGSADNFDVIINVDKGDCEIYQNFDVVEEVENPNTQITLDQIKKETGDDDYEIGDVYTKKLSLASFGRRGILNIRQNLQGRIMDIDKANIFKAYSDKVGEIFSGEIYQTWSKEVIILDDDNNELHLPKAEQIPGERFKKGDTIRVLSGKDKGKEGQVVRSLPSKQRVVVEKVNMVKKAMRPTQQNPQGGITTVEAPLHVSNVMLVCPNCKEATRTSKRVNEQGKKVRVCKKCGKDIDK